MPLEKIVINRILNDFVFYQARAGRGVQVILLHLFSSRLCRQLKTVDRSVCAPLVLCASTLGRITGAALRSDAVWCVPSPSLEDALGLQRLLPFGFFETDQVYSGGGIEGKGAFHEVAVGGE